MTIEQAVLENLRELPTDKQQEVLDFIQFLKHKLPPKNPRPSFYGLWSDLDINITEQDITEIRQEMWAKFPRDIEL
ncbi:DUF2281 domain-containing protein [Anabaena cylindrica FACHB-243]|uniref:DUF2281 domain-containing protein n=1 Tax=Anabaena cylindrica (strain ATCC 27899 / PCC 7122) TaxID=272123 RepID=K9ZET3_ANACC|nr:MULTISPECIES: DUF2281 domain-containing protein [Anabaena]AFZ57244.1 Protein of unknown function DUF2281 [Anabaena cylindrica PCC 7122]MBD2420913.1 DUF2281 domain-containing protein [Anabaena cylindrica FACHB-243]MBY5285465.1 DUF2281 domain-containing protein [Anabaena sp. CCAP 1446/1C]MBY5308684.1 DUF2281 domain-containing protein [Anabaena sp. CCAP 1446/1C]MCM2405666.1 DUF2281 domain-containing protein [Anabaena sp. CCAP 1446/1C]